MNYDEFIARKSMTAPPSGIEDASPEMLGDYLFPFQRDLVSWALQRGKAALFEAVGLGKTRQQLEFAMQASAYLDATGEPSNVLILTPLAVAAQTVREAETIGIDAKYCRANDDRVPGLISVTNYDRLDRFDLRDVGVIVLDECFSPDTMVDVYLENGDTSPVAISSIRPGTCILNAYGRDVVANVHRREVPYAVRVTIAGRSFVCSPNHPIFTQRGWVGAQDLAPGDAALEARAAVRMVRHAIHPEDSRREVLRSILLSEMADAAAGASCEDSQPDRGGEARSVEGSMVSERQSGGGSAAGSDCCTESDGATGREREDLPPVERDRARTFRAWGQRSWFDRASEDSSGCSRTELAGGVCLVTGPTDSRLSDALQARSGAARATSMHRGGWILACGDGAQGAGREEDCEAGFARVDGIEILEPGHPELERLRSADGKLYFYDLGASRHPSFSVGGILVHNSSVIKHQDSKTRDKIIGVSKHIPFRLACTATPAPNDRKELGNHSEFLGVMTMQEMLSEYFVHDSGKTSAWRLKGHAEGHFWSWVASWGAMVTRPSDLGYDDGAYALPPLRIFDHAIGATMDQDRAVAEATERKQMNLIPMPAGSLKAQRKARRVTLEERVKATIDIVMAEPHEQWIVWCELNDEADALDDALTAAIPGAVEIRGSDKAEAKEAAMLGFANGSIRVLVTKPSIAGYGLNWQGCARAAFVGVSHKFEEVHQALGRNHRFGQKREVHAHFIYSELEGDVRRNLARKQREFAEMAEKMRGIVAGYVLENVRGAGRSVTPYNPTVPMQCSGWLADNAEIANV